MPIQHANVGRRVRDELLAARFIQTLEQMRALQVEAQFELARQLRPADVLNYATSLLGLHRFEEGRSLLRKIIPVARRVLGEGHELTLTMRSLYVQTLCRDPNATLDDLREALTTLEDTFRISHRVLGGAYPITIGVEGELRNVRAALRAREEAAPRPAPGTRNG